VLNFFYSTGDLRDPGWLATVTWHNSWRLHGPPAFPGTYFIQHISPILWLTDAVSYIVPLAKFDYYAVCIAAIYALYAAGIYSAWRLTEPRPTAVRTGVAILVALMATFSGVGVVALGLPHTEMAIPAFALWFVIAVARRSYVSAACWLALCLAIREDAGLHVFALLMLWAAVLAWSRRGVTGDVKWLLGFAIAALAYSMVAFVAKRLDFPAGDTLTRIYLGNPPWHHVTVPFVLDRLHLYATRRSYIVLPLLLTVVWAVIDRNPLLPLGYLAALPWLALNFLAVHPTAGGLGYYYSFPFWLALGWPLVALFIGGNADRRWPYGVLLLVSIVGWQRDRLIVYPLTADQFGESPFVYHDTLRDRAQYQTFSDYFLAHRALFGDAALDAAVSGLLMDHVNRSDWLEDRQPNQPPETMIYYVGGYEWRPLVLPLLQTGLYRCIYQVPGTRIRLATRNPLSEALPMPMPIELINGSTNTPC